MVLMTVQQNPFVYGRPITREEDLANREDEKRSMRGDIVSGQAVMLHAPRRYGKTSLARVVAERLQEEDSTPYVYADLWGVRSIADVVGVFGEAYSQASGLSRARRSIAELLRGIGFEVNLGGVLSVRYEGSARGATEEEERRALRELLRVPERMAERSPSGRLLLMLDEFGELNNVPGEPDAPMRAAFQDSPAVSFVFLGSKRSLMDALFSDRRRPFYNFGRRMELGRLAYDELGDFVEKRFRKAGAGITEGGIDLLLNFTRGHPYRAQQIAYHSFEHASRAGGGEADEEAVLAARDGALRETSAEFRAILDGMTSAQRAVYIALCKEPTSEMYSRPYMRRHGIRGPGSVNSAVRTLVDIGELEIRNDNPEPTDPLFATWVRGRMGKPW
jgi:hypothetical protein